MVDVRTMMRSGGAERSSSKKTSKPNTPNTMLRLWVEVLRQMWTIKNPFRTFSSLLVIRSYIHTFFFCTAPRPFFLFHSDIFFLHSQSEVNKELFLVSCFYLLLLVVYGEAAALSLVHISFAIHSQKKQTFISYFMMRTERTELNIK